MQHHELIFSIGVFGLAQMSADMLADLGCSWIAAILRGLGLALLRSL